MRRGMLALAFGLCAAALASADDSAATVVAAKENVTFTVDATGVVDATSSVEVAAKMQVFGDELEVEEFSPGGPVERGALLVRFKSEKIDEALRAAERDLGIARAQLALQTEDQKRQQDANAVALAKATFDAKTAQTSLDTFLKHDLPLRLEESDHNLQGTRNWITDQSEELAQLEKMYKADDLTEETEDIVLKRTRRDLDRSKKMLDFQTRRDRVMRDIDLPRDQEGLTLEARRTATERDRLIAVIALQEAQQRLELERAKANLELQEKQFAKLKADREKFTLNAPESGVAVPGSLSRGHWQNLDDVRRALRKGGKLHPNDVVFTIVKAGAVRVLATVPETAVLSMRSGLAAQVVANAAPDALLGAKVATVSPVAQGADFDVALDLAQPDERLMPGYACKVRIVVGMRPSVMVPAACVEDGFEHAVWLVVEGKPQRRVVRTGAVQDGRVEIVSGLEGGERLLETPPKK